MENSPIIIRSKPGIKRDGTQFEGDNYVDGQWCRFNRGLPRKIGGYQALTSSQPEIVRGMTSFSNNGTQYLHTGSATKMTQLRADSQGIFTGNSDRTPAGFPLVGSSDILWQFDTYHNAVSGEDLLLAHPGLNLNDISNSSTSDIYIGQVNATAALTASSVIDPESGGILSLAPYLIKFGSVGRVGWSAPNAPIDFSGVGSGVAFPTGQKIVKGLPLRGTGSGPAGLLWSLDSLIRMTFNATTDWAFDTISSETSILSSQGVIEYDGVYYWAGVDRFLMFNGVVREIPNELNANYFFDNLNYTHRQKVFAYKVPRWGEIWWCYPRGNATECTHAVIYNVRENTWYDTQLPSTGRSAGIFAKVYNKPFMADMMETTDGFTVWQHETGVDSVNGSTILAVPSHFETADISMLTSGEPQDKSLRISRLEQDFVQVGNMTLTVTGKANARAPEQSSSIHTFTATAATVDEQTIKLKDVRRLMKFKFASNVVSGDYQMGQCIGHIEPADSRVTS